MSDASREAFEKWAKCERYELARCANGPYVFDWTEEAWRDWQAAWTASRQKALQEAAQICDEWGNAQTDGSGMAAIGLASAIRNLCGSTRNEGDERG